MPKPNAPILIGLSAVMVAIDRDDPCVLIRRELEALPFGAFDPESHRTFELGLRDWVREQTGLELGYVEQLYTFGDKDRETPEATLRDAPDNARIISIGYLTLSRQPYRVGAAFEAAWRGWYHYFPWEDHRRGRPALLDDAIIPALNTWAAGNEERQERTRLAFGCAGTDWTEEWVLERYELLYEAGLVAECMRDAGLRVQAPHFGTPMASDHRRILATAIARLRGKIRYRPVIFELMPKTFTLSHLQRVVEAILGQPLHKQNFRRALERSGMVKGTGRMKTGTGGRPAELYRFRRDKSRLRLAAGLSAPKQGQSAPTPSG